MDKGGYAYHYSKALEKWMDFNLESANRLGLHVDSYEIGYIRDHFDEMEQVKLVYDHRKGHFLKIKWESRCWWADDNSMFYYCVMHNVDELTLVEPAVALDG